MTKTAATSTATQNVSCACGAPSCIGITIRIPSSMLSHPKTKTPKGQRTVIHNLVQNRVLFGYPVV